VITFVIFASGLKYAGVGATALGWTLAAVLAASLGIWLAWTQPWRGRAGSTATGGSPAAAVVASKAATAHEATVAARDEPARRTAP
jgi:predicted MFS family arabinose efflux permease